MSTTRIIRPKEAAERLGISIPTLYRWDNAGELPEKVKLTKSGRAVGYREHEIEAMIRPDAENQLEAVK